MSVAINVRRPQYIVLAAPILIGLMLFLSIAETSTKLAALWLVGIALGVVLFHASFGFTGAYRRAIQEKDLSGVSAQFIMLAVAMVLFAPALADGEIFGHRAGGAVAPVSVSMVIGAFVFGIGMQLGGGCASGTLFTAGGGNLRMWVTLAFFCLGGFLATLSMPWWRSLPSMGALSLGKSMGFTSAIALQLAVLGAAYLVLRRLGLRHKTSLALGSFSVRRMLQGPWPLLLGAVLLAGLNWATLAIAGHPWGITWGFTVWAAKAATLVGWDPASSAYWSVAWRAGALNQPILASTTSVMNIGLLIGALAAAAAAGKAGGSDPIRLRPLIASILGGLMLGYGARLAYGCNIGAFFSGVASTSLHGWVWIIAAVAGNVVGVKLRPAFFRG